MALSRPPDTDGQQVTFQELVDIGGIPWAALLTVITAPQAETDISFRCAFSSCVKGNPR